MAIIGDLLDFLHLQTFTFKTITTQQILRKAFNFKSNNYLRIYSRRWTIFDTILEFLEARLETLDAPNVWNLL